VTFLVRRLFVGGAFWAAGLVALAVLLGSADRGGLGDVVDAFLADLRLPAGVTAAVELLALLLRAAATAALVLGAIVVLGRLLGRYLRRPGRSAPSAAPPLAAERSSSRGCSS
jgi:hypothetical protein